MDETMKMIEKIGRNGREPLRVRCLESGEVDKLDNFAARLALKRGSAKRSVENAIMQACSNGGLYLGLHWKRESGGWVRGEGASNETALNDTDRCNGISEHRNRCQLRRKHSGLHRHHTEIVREDWTTFDVV